MAKCLCVNLDKGEYLDFGEFEENNHDDSPVCNTLEYFLATEWKGNYIVFVFEGDYVSDIFPDEDNAYEFVTFNYIERSVLNKVPRFSFVANTVTNEYYFKAALPESDDGTYICPLPFILSEKSCSGLMGISLNEDEETQVGRWNSGYVVATNSKEFCKGFTLFESPYRKECLVIKNLTGLNVVVTGSISGYTRFGVKKLIIDNGGNPKESVTKNTDLLVVGYKPGRAKLESARKNGTKIVYEKEFFEMLGA